MGCLCWRLWVSIAMATAGGTRTGKSSFVSSILGQQESSWDLRSEITLNICHYVGGLFWGFFKAYEKESRFWHISR